MRLVHPLNAVERMLVRPSERYTDFNATQSAKADMFMDVTLSGMVIVVKLLQPLKELAAIDVSPVKNLNSSKLVMDVDLKTPLRSVTAAASLRLNSSSLLVSQLLTQIDFTFASANEMIVSEKIAIGKHRRLQAKNKNLLIILFLNNSSYFCFRFVLLYVTS